MICKRHFKDPSIRDEFEYKVFHSIIESYITTHTKTTYYSPQSNASERVITVIRTYLEKDQREWDLYFCTFGNRSYAIFSLYGFHMFSSGQHYSLARKLISMTDYELKDTVEKKENLLKVCEKSSEWYNRRVRVVRLRLGQEVHRQNIVQSDFTKNINAKYCKNMSQMSHCQAGGGQYVRT